MRLAPANRWTPRPASMSPTSSTTTAIVRRPLRMLVPSSQSTSYAMILSRTPARHPARHQPLTHQPASGTHSLSRTIAFFAGRPTGCRPRRMRRPRRWPRKTAAAPHPTTGTAPVCSTATMIRPAPEPHIEPSAGPAAPTGDPRPATFAEALAQLDHPNDDPDDDPWKAVADFDPPQFAESEPAPPLPTLSGHDDRSFGDDHSRDDAPERPVEPAAIEAMRARDVFGGEAAFGGPPARSPQPLGRPPSRASRRR